MKNELLTLVSAGEISELTRRLSSLENDALSELFATLTDEELILLCKNLESEATAEVLLKIEDIDLKERIISALNTSELKEVMEEISVDDTVELIEEVDATVALRFAEEAEILSLIEDKNYAVLKPLLSGFNPTDLAAILDEVSSSEVTIIFRLLPKELAAETFVEMEADKKETLVRTLSDKELSSVMSELYLDDAVDLVEEMPANVVKRIIAHSDPETRKGINELLKYPSDSAGSIMTTEYVSLSASATVENAFARIRKIGVDSETIYTMYVTDDKKKLIGIVSAKDLLLASPNAKIGDIMEENPIFANTHTDKEDVSRMIAKYGFLALPVVDGEERLVGIVTVDDAMTVLVEENTEDIAKMSGVTPSDKPYLKTSVFRIFLNRLPWLLLLMLSATFAGLIISANESTLNMDVYGIILTACIPMLTGTGGNAGSQASAMIIRGIALGEITFRDTLKVVWKEIRVSILLGLVLSVACFGKLMVVDALYKTAGGITVALTVCLSMLLTVVIAKLIGALLPLLAKLCRLDPAVVASPFITTIVDVLCLTLYCALAVAII